MTKVVLKVKLVYVIFVYFVLILSYRLLITRNYSVHLVDLPSGSPSQ
jgi:hypothetical protein